MTTAVHKGGDGSSTVWGRRPRLVTPPGACDAHIHVFDRRFPEAPTATKATPADASVADYLALQARLGLERVVVVQPTTYGRDNRCQTAAVRALGPCARLVVVLDETAPESDLAALAAVGARGVRFFMLSGGALDWSSMGPVAGRIAPYGWHIELQMNGRDLPERLALLERLPVPIVIDHIGRFMDPVPPDHPAFLALLRLIDGGRVWVKLSAPYVHSLAGPPDFADVAAQARTLVRLFPERMLWASNWPHPGQPGHPDEADLLDLLLEWAPDETVRRRILVDNPAGRYGF